MWCVGLVRVPTPTPPPSLSASVSLHFTLLFTHPYACRPLTPPSSYCRLLSPLPPACPPPPRQPPPSRPSWRASWVPATVLRRCCAAGAQVSRAAAGVGVVGVVRAEGVVVAVGGGTARLVCVWVRVCELCWGPQPWSPRGLWRQPAGICPARTDWLCLVGPACTHYLGQQHTVLMDGWCCWWLMVTVGS